MGHPEITNNTPFAFEPLFIADERLRPVVVTVVKGTFDFDLQGDVHLSDEQAPVSVAGQLWTDAPISSYKYEPEVALCKPATDVVLIGHAHPSEARATHVDVGVKLGPVQKLARVFGERSWVWTNAGVQMTRAAALERTPLIWENAFGGRDATNSTPERPLFEPRNPVGTGFGTPLQADGASLRLPSIEDPNALISQYGEVVPPCGFGFVSPHWQPRAAFAGTFDQTWNESRKPLLPVDFDRRFFNAAAPGLVAPGYLRGDEDVVVLNASSVPRLAFRLPGVWPPISRIIVRGERDVELATNLDTVIVNVDDQKLILLWRAYAPIDSGPHDVTAITIVLN